MKIKSKHEFNCCDPDQVWEKLTDIDLLSSIISDRKGLNKVGKNKYRGKLPVKRNPINGKLDTTFTLKDIKEPKRFSLNVRGKKDKIRVSNRGTFSLGKYEGTTTVNYKGSLKIYFKGPLGAHIDVSAVAGKKAKRSLEKALASLFRKIDRQCCKENNDAH
ncbi:MAG: SRPBCC domain-containing protein [Chloroflexi bacterium]|nr:SRPBCC domain-containing protein [Chloroflexota bacterium]